MTLYKFLKPARTEMLSSFKFRYTPPKYLNDSFECAPVLDTASFYQGVREQRKKRPALSLLSAALGEEKAEELLKTAVPPEAIIQRWNEIMEELNSDVGLLCLAEEPASQLMWAHYGENHTGFIVGFDSDHSYFKNESDDSGGAPSIRPVKYSTNRFVIDPGNSDHINSWDWMLTKSIDWAYEREWRMAKHLRMCAEIVKSGDTSQEIHLFPFPKEMITDVVVGALASPDLKLAIEKLRDAAGLKFPVRNAKKSPTRFALEIE